MVTVTTALMVKVTWIGEAAVTAGIVSPGMVIVVAATGVASFTIPDYTLVNATRVPQIGLFLSAAVLGLYGVTIFGLRCFGGESSSESV